MLFKKEQLRAIRLLVFSDKTKKEIAQELGITEQTLYNWLKDKEFNKLLNSESNVYYSYIRKKTFQKLNSLMLKSFEVIEASLDSKDERVRVKSAFSILSLYTSFKGQGLLDEKCLSELSGLVECAFDEEGYGVFSSMKSKAQNFLNADLTELLDFEENKENTLDNAKNIETQKIEKKGA